MKRTAAVAFAVSTLSISANAYNDDGHFYTIASIINGSILSLDPKVRAVADVVAVCAQMPDLSRELDAVSLRIQVAGNWGGWLWGPFGVCPTPAVVDMVQKHHYLHSLTDQDSGRTRAATLATLNILRKQLGEAPSDVNACALGFAVHAYGDSFAHVRLDNPSRMYPPGMGHFRDDHKPDYVEYSQQRERSWEEYGKGFSAAWQFSPDPNYLEFVLKIPRRELTAGDGGQTFWTDEGRVCYHEDNVRKQLFLVQGPAWQPWLQMQQPRIEALYGSGNMILDPFDRVIARLLPDRAKVLTLSAVWPVYMRAVKAGWGDTVKPACDGARP